jgi:hypothetical protein
LLVTGGADGTTTVRRTGNGESIKTLHLAGRVEAIAFTPSGRRAVTIAGNQLHWWRTDSWDADPPGASSPARPPMRVLGEDAVAVLATVDPVGKIDEERLYTRGNSSPVKIPDTEGPLWEPYWTFGGSRLSDGRWVLDVDTRQVSYAPATSRYHPAAAGAADDGRWLVLQDQIIDLAVQKPIAPFSGLNGEGAWKPHDRPVRMPDGGYCWIFAPSDNFVMRAPPTDVWKVFYVPPPTLNVPPDVLELWVQVILRCELGPGDEIRRWDELTWKRKRQELAARARPTPGFPFPGRIVTDP